MELLKKAIRLFVRLCLHVFYIFPIKRNRIFFSAYAHGVGYCCNPKYICEYLKSQYPGQFEFIWEFNEPRKYEGIQGIIPVKYRSLRSVYYVLTSKAVILNCAVKSYIPKRKQQFVINTWHGGGAYKRVGFSRSSPLAGWKCNYTNSSVDLFLSSSVVFSHEVLKGGYHYPGEIMNCGMPRNDLFFHEGAIVENRSKLARLLGLKKSSVLVLYAPTFRDRNQDLIVPRQVDFPYGRVREKLADRLGVSTDKIIIAVRQHHTDSNCYDSGEMLDVSDYPDMQELLCAADILITDYSSSIWDFALTGKPCFLFVPDLQDYMDNDRGFYTPIETWPGIVCKTEDELCAAIENLDETYCAEKARKHLKALGSYETGHATETVCKRIVEEIKK